VRQTLQSAANKQIVTRKQLLVAGGLLIATPPIGLSAQGVRRVAIVCEAADADSQVDLLHFQTRLGAELLRSGRFSLVDRDRVDRLIREQGFSNSDYADPHLAAKLGRLAGAQELLNTQLAIKLALDQGRFVANLQCEVNANYSLVDVSTGRIVSEDSSYGESQNKVSAATSSVSPIAADALRRQAIDSCVEDMVQKLTN
jgi:hypothetical protein